MYKQGDDIVTVAFDPEKFLTKLNEVLGYDSNDTKSDLILGDLESYQGSPTKGLMSGLKEERKFVLPIEQDIRRLPVIEYNTHRGKLKFSKGHIRGNKENPVPYESLVVDISRALYGENEKGEQVGEDPAIPRSSIKIFALIPEDVDYRDPNLYNYGKPSFHKWYWKNADFPSAKVLSLSKEDGDLEFILNPEWLIPDERVDAFREQMEKVA